MRLLREQQDNQNKTARNKRALLKNTNNTVLLEQKEPETREEPNKEPINPIEEQIEPVILEPINPIEEQTKPNILEPIKQIEPAISKMELLVNRRRETLAVATTKIKPKGFYKD